MEASFLWAPWEPREACRILHTRAPASPFVLTLGEALNFEFSPLGIHVTVLVVGPTQTAIIEKFGLDPRSMPMKPMPPDRCVFEALDAINRNCPNFINGRLNRVMNALIPSRLSRKMMKKMMEQGLRKRGVLR